jgi:hypothetical protein
MDKPVYTPSPVLLHYAEITLLIVVAVLLIIHMA